MVVQRDQSYDDAIAARRYDLYLPEEPSDRPLILMIHGGGWISGDRSMYHDEAAWFSQKGFPCACVGYQLAPLTVFPGAVADIQAFTRFARANGKRLGVQSTKIIAFGNSAGGHLSAMVGLLEKDIESDENSPPVDAFISVSPITDLRNPAECHYPIAVSFVEQFMGTTFFEDPDAFAKASPLVYVKEGATPSLIIHGDADEVVPVDHSKKLHDALKQAGADTDLHILARQGHSFTLDAWNHIRKLSLEFIESQ